MKNYEIGKISRSYKFINALDKEIKSKYFCSGVIDRRMTMAWVEDRLTPAAMLFLCIGITFAIGNNRAFVLTDAYWYARLGTYVENVLNELHQKGYAEYNKEEDFYIINIVSLSSYENYKSKKEELFAE